MDQLTMNIAVFWNVTRLMFFPSDDMQYVSDVYWTAHHCDN